MTICNKCNVNTVPAYRKTKCDTCAKVDEEAYKASQQPAQPIAQPEPVNPEVERPGEIAKETGNFQSTVWNHDVGANSSELGKIGDRHKIYWETVQELLDKRLDLIKAGFLQEEFKPEKMVELRTNTTT